MQTTRQQLEPTFVDRVSARLRSIYPDRSEQALAGLLAVVQSYQTRLPAIPAREWDEKDVVLITYGDQVTSAQETPLATLHQFLIDHELQHLVNTVHVLPFYPYSSDDGFSVVDFRAVAPALGNWSDIAALGRDFRLMFDLVLNHISRKSAWFEGYTAGRVPYLDFFIEADPHDDYTAVTRPRSLPLLTPVQTSRGLRHLWTTFSADQVDLNYANPRVLAEMADVLLGYVEHGASMIRLDAIAYLWKQPGTTCIHLKQTHQVVKLFREILARVAPHVRLITETNVPHDENVSYFGSGDESHMVYQFSLPPLALDAFLTQDGRTLVRWLSALSPAPPGSAYFNFTASHDGIGVRPLQSLIPDDRQALLTDQISARGGLVSTWRRADGHDVPYEWNISFVSALQLDPLACQPTIDAQRFLCSQSLMLAMRGVPGVYFGSLVGTTNDLDAVRVSGIPRRINRRKNNRHDLELQLSDRSSFPAQVFAGYRKLLATRVAQPAFHPQGDQQVWKHGLPWLVAFERASLDGNQRIAVLVNLSQDSQTIQLSDYTAMRPATDLLGQCAVSRDGRVTLPPFSSAWLKEAHAPGMH